MGQSVCTNNHNTERGSISAESAIWALNGIFFSFRADSALVCVSILFAVMIQAEGLVWDWDTIATTEPRMGLGVSQYL